MHESTAKHQPKYQSYLLRIWQDGEQALWHASAQSVQSQEIVHFADLEAFIAFLWAQTTPGPCPPEAHPHSASEE